MRLRRIIAAAGLMLFCAAATGHAEKRVALVVGNAAYRHADKLANPVNDARGVRDALKNLGFDVTYGEDLDQKGLRRAVGQFADRVGDADVAMVYFAGHGATFGDTPYVVPVDAEFSSLGQVAYELVPVETLIGELRQAKGVRIVILDACRDNAAEQELKRQASRGGPAMRGLAPMRNPGGLIIAYATQYLSTAADDAGGTGGLFSLGNSSTRHSPFTAALLNNIAAPGLDVKDMFYKVGRDVITATGGKQRPEISISMYDQYALAPTAVTQPAATPTGGAAPALSGPASEVAQAWALVERTTSMAVIDEFIRQYGNAPIYGALARARREELAKNPQPVAKLTAPTAPAPASVAPVAAPVVTGLAPGVPAQPPRAPAAVSTRSVTEIAGAGATFPYPIYSRWAEAYKKEAGVNLNYMAIGSGGGIKQVQARTVVFGATDAPVSGEDLDKNGLVQFPTVMGGVVPVLNLDGVAPGSLVLDGPTLARIFSGQVKSWDDAAIKALNPGATLPKLAIAVVHRSDGSGTTFNFTNYLSKVSPEWKSKVGQSTAVEWPAGIGAKGNEGVASNVMQTRGAIGYVEYAYARQNKLTYTRMINAAGRTVSPVPETFQAAAASADWNSVRGNGVILTNQPGAQSWPMVAATFVLIPKQPQDPAAAAAALKFFSWTYANGGKAAAELDYVPLPASVVAAVEGVWASEIKDPSGAPIFVASSARR